MTLRQELEARERQWREYHEWEATLPSRPMRDPSAVLADLSWLLQWCSPETLATDPDPEKVGIGKMRAAFALLEARQAARSGEPRSKDE